MTTIRRAQPCPRNGCNDWAILTLMEDIGVGAPLWRCGAGHHGRNFPDSLIASASRLPRSYSESSRPTDRKARRSAALSYSVRQTLLGAIVAPGSDLSFRCTAAIGKALHLREITRSGK